MPQNRDILLFKNNLTFGKDVFMSPETKRRLLRIYEWVFVLLLFFVALAFMISCYLIYQSGENPFTRESIAARFSDIAPLVYVFLCFLVLGFVLKVLVPEEKTGAKAKVETRVIYEKLLSRALVDTEAQQLLEKEKKMRSRLTVATLALLLLGGALGLVFILLPTAHAGIDPNGEVLSSFLVALLALVPSAVMSYLSYLFHERSYVRSVAILKGAPKASEDTPRVGKCEEKSPCPLCIFIKEHKTKLFLGTRVLLIVLGVLFVILGSLNGGALAVLEKAITICSECIGLA